MQVSEGNHKQLFHDISKGDEKAFTELFNSHHGKIYTFAIKLIRSEALAQEVVQDVFLNLWLSRSKLAEVQSPGAYMNRITRNLSFNVLKRSAREAMIFGRFENDEFYTDDSTQDTLDFNESQSLVHQAISKLSPQQKRVYELCHLEGLSYDQAAQQLEISTSTVHFHMKEALRNIRFYLKRMGIPVVILGMLIK